MCVCVLCYELFHIDRQTNRFIYATMLLPYIYIYIYTTIYIVVEIFTTNICVYVYVNGTRQLILYLLLLLLFYMHYRKTIRLTLILLISRGQLYSIVREKDLVCIYV